MRRITLGTENDAPIDVHYEDLHPAPERGETHGVHG
jgi:hypothetical protein